MSKERNIWYTSDFLDRELIICSNLLFLNKIDKMQTNLWAVEPWRFPSFRSLICNVSWQSQLFYADGFMMNQKGYFVISLVDRGQMIIICLLQLLLGSWLLSGTWDMAHLFLIFSYLSLLIMENIGSLSRLFHFLPSSLLYSCWCVGQRKVGIHALNPKKSIIVAKMGNLYNPKL